MTYWNHKYHKSTETISKLHPKKFQKEKENQNLNQRFFSKSRIKQHWVY
jgi:hypothetical protein